ncbi:LOW QUALITY PROTEIN: S-adenosylmethionine-dependent methyltransferase [Psychrobacter sp. JCM 18900]|nr:LOW QUALITY PROTEIN: S-adenosylmethionine-dependent methyltransferase [Psychrobacter sp. JCM 18900]
MTTKHQDSQPDSNLSIPAENERADRSFDAIADHFEKKVYGGLKGEIRLAVLRRDIFEYSAQMSEALGRPLRILDVGAGLAQIAIELAAQGHSVVINDISANMLEKAKASAEKNKARHNMVCLPLSSAGKTGSDRDSKIFDYVARATMVGRTSGSHGLFFDKQLIDGGALSVCFYNPASFDYRNLIMGNFNLLDSLLDGNDYKADNKKSLTPNHPVAKEEVESWLKAHDYQTVRSSGLRVFHDYAPLKRGGHNDPDAVIRMELRYSQLEPYKWLGRYLHILAKR